MDADFRLTAERVSIFMLSQRTRYAIRALQHLADRFGAGPVQLVEIAEAQNIPAKFLTVILSEMKRAGLVETLRGKEGGYWLAPDPDKVTYGDIVRLTRGSLALVPCASRLAYEKMSATCAASCSRCATKLPISLIASRSRIAALIS